MLARASSGSRVKCFTSGLKNARCFFTGGGAAALWMHFRAHARHTDTHRNVMRVTLRQISRVD
jgi:hypothetical protein